MEPEKKLAILTTAMSRAIVLCVNRSNLDPGIDEASIDEASNVLITALEDIEDHEEGLHPPRVLAISSKLLSYIPRT